MKRIRPALLSLASVLMLSAGPGAVAAQGGAAPAAPQWPAPVKASANAPNIVVILLDDVGYGASSTFGGPSATPALQGLADTGLRYTNFNVTALCSPTRAALLSGRNAHRIGNGIVAELARPQPGYNSVWPASAASVAEVLRANGYSTSAFGKWHNTPAWEVSPVGPFDRWPAGKGFDYFYGFMEGETSQWEPVLYRNTAAVERPAGKDYYLPTDMTDESIDWVRTQRSLAPDKPFFLYYSTAATHVPLHVPKDWIDKYSGRFDKGWDVLREEIFARQKAAGVIPASTILTERPKAVPAWESLSPERQKIAARQMEVYAAFLAQTDHEIGRLTDTIRKLPGGDNTLIIYIAGDNGADALAGVDGSEYAVAQNLYRISPPISDRLAYLDRLGSRDFDNAHSSGWAWALSTPFKGVKGDGSHFGGTRVGMVVSWPAGIKDKGGVRTQFTNVTDVASTLYEVTGITPPDSFKGEKQMSLDGVSFAYSFDNAKQRAAPRVQYFETIGNRALYKDGWIAAAKHWLPWDNSFPGNDFDAADWELYNVDKDYSEATDLAEAEPAKLAELRALFDREARANDVYPFGNVFSGGPLGQPGPSLTGNRKHFTYYPSGQSFPMLAAPNLTRSHRIVADLDIPRGGAANGTIMSVGSRYGGVTLYADAGHLVYENNYFGVKRDTLKASAPLPPGKVRVAFDLTRDSQKIGGGGVGRLLVNGDVVSEQHIDNIGWSPGIFGAFDIGATRVSPVSTEYAAPFAFTGGEIEQVSIELK